MSSPGKALYVGDRASQALFVEERSMRKEPDRSETPAKHSRTYPSRPLVGIGALIVRENRIVLVRRGSPPLQGEWSIPGGLVRVGETLAEAVVRESFEETGLSVEPGELVKLLERIIRDRRGKVQYHYVIADFLCSASTGDPRPGSDAMEAEWVTREESEEMGLDEIALEAVSAAFDRSRARSSAAE
jgi:ADP-ribose pyrophosphatase YjhB (NUDIX family)